MNPLISIIVPVYNQEKYLARCLNSILNQTYKNLEVICIDDKSTDSTADIINQYKIKDSRVVYYRNIGKGVSAARNFGIEKANGEYIGFADSDDFVQPQMYEFLLKAVTDNNCEMAACGYERVDEANYRSFEYQARECKTSEFVDMYNFEKIIKNEMILSSVCTKLVQKEFLKKYGRFGNYTVGEDTVFCAGLWANSSKAVLVDLPLYGYFNNPHSVLHKKIDTNKIDLMCARLAAYKIYKNYDEKTAACFLFRNVARMERCVREKELTEKSSYTRMNRIFMKCVPHFLRLKELNLKEKLFYISKFISNYFKYKFKNI